MPEKEFAPILLTPGVSGRIESGEGEAVEVRCDDDPKVLDFIEKYAELRMFENAKAQRPAMAFGGDYQIGQELKAKVEAAWNELPIRVFQAIEDRKGN